MKLSDGINRYVAAKRKGGLLYSATEYSLITFKRKLGDPDLDQVTSQRVLAYLDGTSPMSWRKKHQELTLFFAFCSSRGYQTVLPMPPPRPIVRTTFSPYIYSAMEIQALLRTTRVSQTERRCRLPAETLYTLLLFLYGTGATKSEALALTLADVNLKTGFVFIRKRQAERSRRIPICNDLQIVLTEYLGWRSRNAMQSDRVFVKNDGHALANSTLAGEFRRLRELAGIRRPGSSDDQPRIHDLRYSFAVHRITSWIRSNSDLNRMLPALAVYMGHAGLWATERYLLMTPERLRKQLNILSPLRTKKHWRDDETLLPLFAGLSRWQRRGYLETMDQH
jgi:integrase/recombinase XerD